MFTHVFSCLAMLTRKTYVYHSLPMFTRVLFLPFLTCDCLPIFFQSLPMLTHVYLCLLVYSYSYSCLLMFKMVTRVKLFILAYLFLTMVTRFYLFLLMFNHVYLCLPLFIRTCLPIITHVYSRFLC